MYDINVIKRYFESIYETREIENIAAKELNVQLAKFFMNVRKRNGSVYEPTSLKDFQRSLQRYLNDKSSTMNILQDQVFAKSREVLIAKKRELVPETGSELLLWKAERCSNTRHGDGQHQRALYPTAQATHNERCPVQLYRAFSQHRPDEMKQPDSSFFLAIRLCPKSLSNGF